MLSCAKLLILAHISSAIPYKLCRNGSKYIKPKCERIFVYNKDISNFVSLLNVTLLNNYGNDSSSIRGTIVRVLAQDMLPYITSNNYSHKLEGFLGDTWQMMERRLGFTSVISSVAYDKGLVMLSDGKADVLLGAAVAKDGLLNIMYSQPYFYNWYHLFLKTPAARASSLSYLKTFDNELWLVALIAFALLTATLWLTTNILHLLRKEKGLSVPSCFLGSVSGFINQGFDLKLSSYSARMQLMFALILGVVLFSAMNAVLVAQLAVFDIPFPFKSLDDIARRRTHSLCLRTNSFVYNNFTQNKQVLEQWRGILNGRHCKDIISQENLASILCNDGVVVLENRVVMDMILKKYDIPCKIMNSQGRLFETGNSFLLMKGFRYKKLINNMALKMRTVGILQRLEFKWIRRETMLNINTAKTPEVTLDHIQGVLWLYSTLILISLLILALEKVHFRYTRDKFVYLE